MLVNPNKLTDEECLKLSNIFNGPVVLRPFKEAGFTIRTVVKPNRIDMLLVQDVDAVSDIDKLVSLFTKIQKEILPKWLEVFLGHRGPKRSLKLTSKYTDGDVEDVAGGFAILGTGAWGPVFLDFEFDYTTTTGR